jgi:hypothetical protein
MSEIRCIINYAYLESDHFKLLQQKSNDRFSDAIIIDDPHKPASPDEIRIIDEFIYIPDRHVYMCKPIKLKYYE